MHEIFCLGTAAGEDVFHSTVPWLRLSLRRYCRVPQNCSAHVFRTLEQTPSGSAALFYFSLSSCFFSWLLEKDRLEGVWRGGLSVSWWGEGVGGAELRSMTEVEDDIMEVWVQVRERCSWRQVKCRLLIWAEPMENWLCSGILDYTTSMNTWFWIIPPWYVDKWK